MLKTFLFSFMLLMAVNTGLQARRVGCDAMPEAVTPWNLDFSAKKLAIAFSPPQDMEARVLAAAFEGSSLSPAVKFSLYAGDAEPAELLASSQGVAPGAAGWASAPLQPVALKGGASYFFVIEADPNRGGVHPVEQASPSYAAKLSLRKGLGRGTALAFDGKRWSRLQASPLWAVQAAAGLSLGQSYERTESRPIYQGHSQGQAFHWDCGTTPSLLRVRVRAVGKPSAPLKWALQRHNYMQHLAETMVQGELLTPAKASKNWAWVQASLPASVGALAPECHYFALSSESGRADGTACQDCWEVSAARVLPGLSSSQDLSSGGGAHRDRATSGADLVHWADDYDADLHLQVDGNDCPSSKFETAPLRLLPRPRALNHGGRP